MTLCRYIIFRYEYTIHVQKAEADFAVNMNITVKWFKKKKKKKKIITVK